MINVIKKIPKASPELIAGFSKQAVATVHEAMGRKGAMNAYIRPIAPGMKFCGRAITVSCHAADNLMLVKAISMAKEGDVIVADMGRLVNEGPFGEVLAVECVTKKMAGLVVTSSVRDTAEIKAMNFPVFSAGVSVCGTAKATLGTINHVISCADVIVKPGDIVLGDDDGVVVVPLEIAEEVLKKSEERVAKEEKLMERIRNGESAFDIYGYQSTFDKLGCVEEED